MSERTKNKLLFDFFASYFHEDWEDDAANPEAVVVEYRQTGTSDKLHDQVPMISSSLIY